MRKQKKTVTSDNSLMPIFFRISEQIFYGFSLNTILEVLIYESYLEQIGYISIVFHQ